MNNKIYLKKTKAYKSWKMLHNTLDINDIIILTSGATGHKMDYKYKFFFKLNLLKNRFLNKKFNNVLKGDIIFYKINFNNLNLLLDKACILLIHKNKILSVSYFNTFLKNLKRNKLMKNSDYHYFFLHQYCFKVQLRFIFLIFNIYYFFIYKLKKIW